jgi:photosystem II stability/assembly factor-like uncharacterized protein
MRKALLFMLTFLIVVLFSGNSIAQIDLKWKWMHPKPQGNTFRYVKVFSATNIVAVGYAGAFMSTTNGGTSWTIYENAGGFQQPYGLGRSLYSGWFFNMTTGLVCGTSGWIARTTTGGNTWDSLGSGSTSTLYGMHFINANTGFIGGSSGTILKTTNAGLTWTTVTSGTTGTIYNIFAVDENHIYAPSTSGSLRITTNGGTSWTAYSTGGSTLYDANFINANTGYVCGTSGHVKRTSNGGTNWTSINIPSVTSTFYELFVTSQTTTPFAENFTGTTFPPAGWRAVNVSGSQVWVRSTAQYHSSPASAFINYDCSGYSVDWLITPQIPIYAGDSVSFWLRTHDVGFPPDSLCVRVSNTDTALASFTTRVLYLAEGAGYPGNTWTRFAASMNAFAGQNVYIGFKHANNCGDGIYIDDVQVGTGGTQSVVYVVGDPFYIYYTANMGANWTQMDHLNPSQIWTSTWYSMDKNGTTLAAVGASGLINRSTNNGANWTNYNTWIFAGTFYDVWAEYNNTKILAVGSGSNDTKILYSSNGGSTWVPRDIPTSKYFRSISMINANTGYIAGSSGGVFKTTNGGANWDSLPFPGTQLLYRTDFVNANTGWVTSSSSTYIWKTSDGGNTWNTQAGATSSTYWMDMVDANTGWFVGSSGTVKKTVDGGANWTAQTSGTTSTLYSIKMLDANTGYLCGTSGALRKTTNGGTNWETIATPYSSTLYTTDWKNVNNGFIGGSSGYTAKTTNGGTTWTVETTSGSTIYSVYMNHTDSAWACGTLQALFKWAQAPQGVITWNGQVPNSYYIDQNYPNPFNPSTTIKFGIPKAGKVSLNVYDITGRLVAELFNNAPLNAGNVIYKFDGSNLASGVYFYTLIVDNNKIDTKKMVLVK